MSSLIVHSLNTETMFDVIVCPDSKTINRGMILYIKALIKKDRAEFEKWKNGFGLRSTWSKDYPKQNLFFKFGDKRVFVELKNSPHRSTNNGNFCYIRTI